MQRTAENISTIERQVGRLRSMNFGCNLDRCTELTDAFLGFATVTDVRRAVSHFIGTVDEAPTVAQVLNHQRCHCTRVA